LDQVLLFYLLKNPLPFGLSSFVVFFFTIWINCFTDFIVSIDCHTGFILAGLLNMVAPFFANPPSIINKPDGSVLFEVYTFILKKNRGEKNWATFLWIIAGIEIFSPRFLS
jgi:hypothetical protein